MEDGKLFTLTGRKNWDYAYDLAYKLAGEQLAKIDDIEQQCQKSGAQYRVTGSKKEAIIHYLAQSYSINLPDGEISSPDSAEPVPIRDKLLILHYLISARGTPLAGRLITFRELPEGVAYFPTFSKRTIKPLVTNFGQDPRLLVNVGEKLGGQKTDYGDTAVTVKAFPFVPITVILWRGDDEFAPEGNVAFDATITDYLPTEDIIVLCENIIWKMVRYLRDTKTHKS